MARKVFPLFENNDREFLLLFFFFETRSHGVAQPVLELTSLPASAYDYGYASKLLEKFGALVD